MRCLKFVRALITLIVVDSAGAASCAEAGHVSLLQTRAVLLEMGGQKNLAALQPMPMGSISRFASSDLKHVQIQPSLSYHKARGLFGGRRKRFGKGRFQSFASEEHQLASEAEWENAVEKIALDTVETDAAERDRLSEEARRSAEKEMTEIRSEDEGDDPIADSDVASDEASEDAELLADKEAIALDAEVDKIAAERLGHDQDDRLTNGADCDPTGCPRDEVDKAMPNIKSSEAEGQEDQDEKEETVDRPDSGIEVDGKKQQDNGDIVGQEGQESQGDQSDTEATEEREYSSPQQNEGGEFQEDSRQLDELEELHVVKNVKGEPEKEHPAPQKDDLPVDRNDLGEPEVRGHFDNVENPDNLELHDDQEDRQETQEIPDREADLEEEVQPDEHVEQRIGTRAATQGLDSTEHTDDPRNASLIHATASLGEMTGQGEDGPAQEDTEATVGPSRSSQDVSVTKPVQVTLHGKNAESRHHKGIQEDVDSPEFTSNSTITVGQNRSSSTFLKYSDENVTIIQFFGNSSTTHRVERVSNAEVDNATADVHNNTSPASSLSLTSAHAQVRSRESKGASYNQSSTSEAREVASMPHAERHAILSNHSSSVILAPGAYYIINARLQKYLNTLGGNVSVWHKQNLSARDWPKGLLWKFEPVANQTNTFALGSVEHESYLNSDDGLVNMWKPPKALDASVGGPEKVQWSLVPVDGQDSTFYFLNAEREMYMSSFGGSVSTWRGKSLHDLGSQPGNMQWVVVRAETNETASCDAYASEAPGCDWTSKWSCPGQARGSKGVAGPHSHNTTGYRCCCRLGLWSAPRLGSADMSAAPAAAIETMGELANVTEVVRHLQADPSSAQLAALNATQPALPPLAFVKTHRTGSSTVANIVQRLGDARGLSFVLPAGGQGHAHSLGWPSIFPGPEAVAFNGLAAHQFDAICNNAVYNGDRMREFLKATPEPFFFTVIRKPVEQTQSAFQFNHAPCGSSWPERIAWLDNISDGGEAHRISTLRAQFQNPQAHDLGWYEKTASGRDVDHDDQKIQVWLDGLEAQFGLVILQDFLEEGLILLKAHLGLSTADVVHLDFKRSTAVDGREKPTAEQAAAIDGLQSVDAALYHRFSQVFWRKWGEAGGKATLAPQLVELRAANAKLAKDCAGVTGGGPEDPDGDSSKCQWRFRADTAEYTELLRGERLGAKAAGFL